MKSNNKIYQRVILNSIQDLQRLSLPLINSLRGRSRIKYGMTASYNNGGFTLIELLVVVLIIGILAAVAVPQYQYAVQKARYTQYMNTSEALYKAQLAFKLANGYFTPDASLLDISYDKKHMFCTFATNSDPESGVTACGPTLGDTSLPKYGRWLYDANTPRVCLSNNSYPNQAEFCKKITGQKSGSVWGQATIWRF